MTYHSVDGHVEETSWATDSEETIDVFEDENHHLVLVGRRRLVFRLLRR